ncbi:hypothetical protein V8E36_001864 [Tilletia maclaganii]
MQSASTANAWRLIGPWTRTSAGMWSPREAFYLLDLINNQVDIIYDYDASILILKHVDLIVHHAPPPWSSSSLTAVWVHHQEVGSYYEQGLSPASVKVSTLGSTSTSHQHGPCPPPRLQCRGRDKVSLADAISAFGTWWRCFTMVVDDAASPCGMENSPTPRVHTRRHSIHGWSGPGLRGDHEVKGAKIAGEPRGNCGGLPGVGARVSVFFFLFPQGVGPMTNCGE